MVEPRDRPPAFEAAQAYLAAGICVLPIKPDGSPDREKADVRQARRRPAGTDAAGGFRGRCPWGPGGRRSLHQVERADPARLRAGLVSRAEGRPTLAVLDGDLRQWIRDGSKPPELPRAGRKPARKG